MDPLLTDEEIIQTFTPLELRFHQWYEKDPYRFLSVEREIDHLLEEDFPDVEDVFNKFESFAVKWLERPIRRMHHSISPKEFYKLVKSIDCKNPDEFSKALWIINMHNCPGLLLGESHFGGVLTGYSLSTGAHLLYPDMGPREMSNPDNPSLIDRAVMAFDLETGPALPPQSHPGDPRKRRQENRSFGEDSVISTRSAESDDFSDKEPFCFLQIGSLQCCTGEDWERVRGTEDLEEVYDADWMDTGYGVMIHLSPLGYPTGPVYVAFNFHQPREGAVKETDEIPFWEEIEWRDKYLTELPHIRRLYPGCSQQFFVAKIANDLEDLKQGVKFDFEVTRADRCTKFRAKRQGIHQKIIPNNIVEEVSAADVKRLNVGDH